MERRPLSAPGYHPADSPANGEGEDGNGTEVMAEFAEMEERASEAMGKENRGHKLPLKELPLKRPRLLSGRASAVVPPTEDEFEEVERTFCEYCHYRKASGTAGLDPSQVRLLHSGWSHFASSEGLLANALHLPQRLNEAGANIGVRHDLAGAALGILSNALMRMIEEEHERLVLLSRLIERLNLQLAVVDDEGDATNQRVASSPTRDSAPSSPSNLVPTPNRPDPETFSLIMEVLALSNEQARQFQRALRRLAGTRALLVQATQYGHLLGRFLIKRHRRMMERRRATLRSHRAGGVAKARGDASVSVRQ